MFPPVEFLNPLYIGSMRKARRICLLIPTGFTLDTYTHVTTQMQEDAAKKIGGFMAAAQG